MRIAVIGAGAMGSIYGGHLSLHNDVWLIDTNPSVIEHLQKEGLILEAGKGESLQTGRRSIVRRPGYHGSGDSFCESPVFQSSA